MPVAVCPSAETLAAFARGDLSERELSRVADHIGACTACGNALRFVPEDSLADLARAAAASPETVRSSSPPVISIPPVTEDDIPKGFENHPRYRIICEIGAGGMGTVYKAEDLLMGRVVAIKVVSAHLTAKTSAVERFQKEIKAAAQLKDHRIVTAYDAGEAGGSHFLVMEFLEGVSLDRLITKKGSLPVTVACAFTRQAALGLQHAADKGMVHRDIKPQNLMVTRKGQVKILDFGIARFARPDGDGTGAKVPFGAGKVLSRAGATNPNVVMGTPDYLSPEQAVSSHNVDPRSDIYSLGCTLYFLLTGKAPFIDAPTFVDKLLAHANDEPPAVRDARPEVPEGLVEVLDKMMAKKPEDRYQSAAEAASALQPFTRSDSAKEPVFEIVDAIVVTPKPALPTRLAEPSDAGSDTGPVTSGPTVMETTKKPKCAKKKKASWWKRRKGTVLATSLAVLFLVTAGVIVTQIRKLTDPPTEPTHVAKVDPQNSPPPGKTDKTDKSEKGEKGEKGSKGEKSPPVPPLVITPPAPKELKVLYVIPSHGVKLGDFVKVRDHLKSKGVEVVTAALEGDKSKASPPFAGPPVPIDKRLKEDMDLSEYAVVVFCGDLVDEYMPGGRGSAVAGKVILRLQAIGKPMAAIGLGLGVLATHDALRGKKAADCRPLFDRYPTQPWNKMNITWDKPGVTVDDKVITASGGREAIEFADAILKMIDGK